jgi:hypothetical protein
MTVSTEENTISYTGNNSTTDFSFPYLFYANGDLLVTLDGVTQTITTHYTVTGAGVAAGGTVAFVTAPGTDVAIVIQRVVDYTQATDLENFDGNPADVTEKQLDLLAMMAQQLSEADDRGIKIPVGESTTVVLSAAATRANELLSFDVSGNVTTTGLADISAMATPTTSTDNAVVRFNGTTGLIIQDSGVTIDDSDNVTATSFIGAISVLLDTTPQLSGDLDCNGSQIQWSQGADVASATAVPVLTDGKYFDVTGTTTIATINTTGGVGTLIKLHFDDALTLTDDADNIILPGGANIATAAGDEAEFIEYATGKYRCTNYSKADPSATTTSEGLVEKATQAEVDAGTDTDRYVTPETLAAYSGLSSGLTLGTPIATTSGTNHVFTGIPAGTTQFTLSFTGVAVGSTGSFTVRIGDAGGIETSGYLAGVHQAGAAGPAVHTASFGGPVDGVTEAHNGSLTFTLIDASTFTWAISGALFATTTNDMHIFSGSKSLSAELDRVDIQQITAGTFNAGKINIAYQ